MIGTRSFKSTLLALLSTSLLAACLGSNPPKEEHFYFLTGPTKVVEQEKGPRLGVADLSVTPGYESQRLAYRVAPNHLRYYGYRQWVSEPAKMLTDMVIRYLRASGLFAEVGPADRIREPDGILLGHVVAIEEVDDAENSKWSARLAITFHLQTLNERVLFRHSFDKTRPCARRDPEDVARMISKIYAVEMGPLARRIASVLAQRRKAIKSDVPTRSVSDQ